MLWTILETYHSNEDMAKDIDEEVVTMAAEDGKACTTQVDFAREHEEENVRLEISTPPSFLEHQEQKMRRSSWQRPQRAK